MTWEIMIFIVIKYIYIYKNGCIYIYIYTPVFKNVAFLKTYVIYTIMPFLRLYLYLFFVNTRKDIYVYRKKRVSNGHNGITLLKSFFDSYIYMIYISEIAMFLKTGVYRYIYIERERESVGEKP